MKAALTRKPRGDHGAGPLLKHRLVVKTPFFWRRYRSRDWRFLEAGDTKSLKAADLYIVVPWQCHGTVFQLLPLCVTHRRLFRCFGVDISWHWAFLFCLSETALGACPRICLLSDTSGFSGPFACVFCLFFCGVRMAP